MVFYVLILVVKVPYRQVVLIHIFLNPALLSTLTITITFCNPICLPSPIDTI